MPATRTDNPERPDPVMTTDGAFFWKAADEGRFVAQKCGACGQLRHPPRGMCPACHSTEKVEHSLSGRGRVLSWIQPVHPAAVGFAEPPVVAVVELEEGLRLVSNVEDVDPAAMQVGMQVAVAFASTRGGHQVPVFVPAAGEGP